MFSENHKRLGTLLKSARLSSFFWILILMIRIDVAMGGHFPAPVPSERSCYFSGLFKINGLEAQPGDEVAFFDPQGILCGLYVVLPEGYAGQYGFLNVYADDIDTLQDEGADPGDILTVRVWDANSRIEYEGYRVLLSSGSPMGESVSSSIPPRWTRDREGLRLDIDTPAPAGDIDGDSKVTLQDAVLSLKLLSGSALSTAPEGADVNGDARIGLEESIYILQKISGFR